MKDRDFMDSGKLAKPYNEQYVSGIKGAPKGGRMTNHGNTSSITTTQDQQKDMGRIREIPSRQQGNNPKAFKYKY